MTRDPLFYRFFQDLPGCFFQLIDRPASDASQYKFDAIEFIETVLVYQFPHWSREEIEKMLQVSDVRQTRVFQEAKEEGKQEGKDEATATIAARLLEIGHPIDEVAKVTGLSEAQIQKLKKKKSGG